ncbi:hypothetical protein Tco_0614040 [Tanacetum coccineum]
MESGGGGGRGRRNQREVEERGMNGTEEGGRDGKNGRNIGEGDGGGKVEREEGSNFKPKSVIQYGVGKTIGEDEKKKSEDLQEKKRETLEDHGHGRHDLGAKAST